MNITTLNDYLTASRDAGTLEAVEMIAEDLADKLGKDSGSVLSILHRDRDESNEIARRRRELDFEVWTERLDERTREALDALPEVVA